MRTVAGRNRVGPSFQVISIMKSSFPVAFVGMLLSVGLARHVGAGRDQYPSFPPTGSSNWRPSIRRKRRRWFRAWRSTRPESCWPPSATTTSCGCSTSRAASSCIAGRRTPTGSRRRPSGPTVRCWPPPGPIGAFAFGTSRPEARLRNLSEPLQVIYTLAYSPDGRILAAAGFADKVWVFDADQGKTAPRTGRAGQRHPRDRLLARRHADGRGGTRRAGPHLGCRQRAASGRRAGLRAADLRPGLFARRKAPGGGRPAADRAAAGCVVGQAAGRSAGAAGRSAGALLLRPRPAGLGRQRQRDSSLGRGLAAGAMPVGRPHRLDHDAGLQPLRGRR